MCNTDRLRRIDERLQRIEEVLSGPLLKVSELADQLDVTRRTIRDRCRREGIKLRNMHGEPWGSDDSGSPQYVDRRAWQKREALSTRKVKKGLK
jgi:DeoR/GlpR family transcriptional regulator of sugar metabolism